MYHWYLTNTVCRYECQLNANNKKGQSMGYSSSNSKRNAIQKSNAIRKSLPITKNAMKRNIQSKYYVLIETTRE